MFIFVPRRGLALACVGVAGLSLALAAQNGVGCFPGVLRHSPPPMQKRASHPVANTMGGGGGGRKRQILNGMMFVLQSRLAQLSEAEAEGQTRWLEQMQKYGPYFSTTPLDGRT